MTDKGAHWSNGISGSPEAQCSQTCALAYISVYVNYIISLRSMPYQYYYASRLIPNFMYGFSHTGFIFYCNFLDLLLNQHYSPTDTADCRNKKKQKELIIVISLSYCHLSSFCQFSAKNCDHIIIYIFFYILNSVFNFTYSFAKFITLQNFVVVSVITHMPYASATQYNKI